MLPDAAGGHAAMRGLDDHGHAARPERIVQRMGDLVGEPFLELKPAGECVDQARQLRNPDDPLVRPIADMGDAEDRREMMFAGRDQRNGSQQDSFVITVGFGEDAFEQGGRIDAIASEPFARGSGDSRWRVDQAFPQGIVAGRGEDGPDRRLDLGARRADRNLP